MILSLINDFVEIIVETFIKENFFLRENQNHNFVQILK